MNLTLNGCFQCVTFSLPKSKRVQRNRLSRGRKWFHLLFSFTLHPEFNSAAARSSFTGPAKPSPQESLSFGLVFFPNGQKMLDLPGKAHWLGTAFPRGGQWLWNLLSELSLFASSLFISAACFRAPEWFGIGHWSVRLTAPPAFRVLCKNLGEALLFWGEMVDFRKPLLSRCSGQQCQDCSKNAFFLSTAVAWSV